MGVKASLVEQSATSQPVKFSLPHVLFSSTFCNLFSLQVFYSSSHGGASRVPSGLTEPPEAPVKFLSEALFLKKISWRTRGGGNGEKKCSEPYSLKITKNFPYLIFFFFINFVTI